jgi:hypothetical protein
LAKPAIFVAKDLDQSVPKIFREFRPGKVTVAMVVASMQNVIVQGPDPRNDACELSTQSLFGRIALGPPPAAGRIPPASPISFAGEL